MKLFSVLGSCHKASGFLWDFLPKIQPEIEIDSPYAAPKSFLSSFDKFWLKILTLPMVLPECKIKHKALFRLPTSICLCVVLVHKDSETHYHLGRGQRTRQCQHVKFSYTFPLACQHTLRRI